jgi:hypothetical protein
MIVAAGAFVVLSGESPSRWLMLTGATFLAGALAYGELLGGPPAAFPRTPRGHSGYCGRNTVFRVDARGPYFTPMVIRSEPLVNVTHPAIDQITDTRSPD